MEDGVRRKLPSWMSRVNNIADPVGEAETEKGVQFNNNVRDETASQSLHLSSKATAKPLIKDPCSAHETSDYGPKKRKGKKLNQGADGESSCTTEVCETLVERKKGNIGGRKIKNKRKERSHEKCEKVDSPPNEDDVELTVEDLLTIAQEYIRRDEDSGQEQLSDESHDGKINSAIALSVHHYVPSQSNKEPRMSKETIPIHNSIARTEDPAQDMLELFLGPLLKKTVPDDKMNKTIKEDKTFVSKVNEQLCDNSSALADCVPLTKKKSSLKDKVAKIFD